ncbi:MAG TPA: LacI family DNA-binding transcriptional regulator [Polyangiaceae bacterium]
MRKASKVTAFAANVTIKDVAEHLGISHSTVSRALSDHPSTNAQTKIRVREAVEQLGYVPNAAARNLRRDRGTLVGLILPDIENELFGVVAQVMSRRCLKQGYQMVLAVSDDDPVTEYNHIMALREARCSGIIMTPTPGLLEKTVELLHSVPVVQYSRHSPLLNAPSVSVDGERGVYVATQHLLQLGHQRVAYIGMASDKSTGIERLAGFRKAHQERKVAVDSDLIRLGPFHREFAREAAGDLLQLADRPTAMVLGASAMTIGALQAVRQASLEMPGDISLVCFGDAPWYSLMNPGLTTIGLPTSEIADVAASQLLRLLVPGTGPNERNPTHLAVEPAFIVRGTTAAPPRGLARKAKKARAA